MQLNITKCLVFALPLFAVGALGTSIWMDLKEETRMFESYKQIRGRISGKECANHGYVSAEYRVGERMYSNSPKLIYAKPNCSSSVIDDSVNLWISTKDNS